MLSKTYTVLTLIIVVAIVVLGILYGKEVLIQLGFSETPSTTAPSATTSTTTSAVATAVHQTQEITGVVQAIDGSSVTVTTYAETPISVKLTATTKFYKGVPKAFNTSAQESSTASPSELFTRTAGSLAEIKTGDMIIATLERNTKDATLLVAAEVMLLQKPDLRSFQ